MTGSEALPNGNVVTECGSSGRVERSGLDGSVLRPFPAYIGFDSRAFDSTGNLWGIAIGADPTDPPGSLTEIMSMKVGPGDSVPVQVSTRRVVSVIEAQQGVSLNINSCCTPWGPGLGHAYILYQRSDGRGGMAALPAAQATIPFYTWFQKSVDS